MHSSHCTLSPQCLPSSSYLAIDGANNYGDHYLGTQLRKLLGPFIDAVKKEGPGNLENEANLCISFAAANGPYVADLYLNSVLPLAAAVPTGTPASVFQAHAVTQTAISHFHLVACRFIMVVLRRR